MLYGQPSNSYQNDTLFSKMIGTDIIKVVSELQINSIPLFKLVGSVSLGFHLTTNFYNF